MEMLSEEPSGFSDLGLENPSLEEGEEEAAADNADSFLNTEIKREEEKPLEKLMTREAFSTIIAKVVPDVMEEKIDARCGSFCIHTDSVRGGAKRSRALTSLP